MTGDLETLLPTGTVRVLTHFLVHPDSQLHFRALHRHTGISIHSLQREVARLEALGLLHRHEEDHRVTFHATPKHPSWEAFRTLLRAHARPAAVLRDALQDVEGISAAFVFGSQVHGPDAGAHPRPDSHVDVLIYGDAVAADQLGDALLRVQSLLGRAVDVKRYTTRKLQKGLERGAPFLHDVLTGPKEWLVGSAEELPEPARGMVAGG